MQNTPESGMNRTPAHPKGKGKTIEQQHAERALLGASNLTETEAQVLWAFCGRLVRAAQNAEHSALMLLSEKQNPHINYRTEESAADFQKGVTAELGNVRGELQAIGKLLRDGLEKMKAEEGKVA